MVHAFFDPSQASTFEELSLRRDSTFIVKYFGTHGPAATPRLILAVSNASFTNDFPRDWVSEKRDAPFGVIPILTEISADGSKKIQIAESDAIERYLAKKFGLSGDNAFEEVLVDTYCCSTKALTLQISTKYLNVKNPELKREGEEKLVTDTIPTWIRYHERHLTDKGANGHYVGDKLTLADLRTALAIVVVQSITGEDQISQEKTPSLWSVKLAVDNIPSVIAMKATESATLKVHAHKD